MFFWYAGFEFQKGGGGSGMWDWALGCVGFPFLASESSGLEIFSGGTYNKTICSIWAHKNNV